MPFCPHCGERVGDRDTLCRSCGQTIAPSTAGNKTCLRVVVCLFVGAGCLVMGTAMVGILAAIFIPNYVDALQRARQRRTVSDLRSTSVVLLSYVKDHQGFPEADTIEDLAAVLASDPGEQIAVVDGWKRPYRYECLRADESAAGCTGFRLASAGRDGLFEHESLADYDERQFDPREYDRDLVAGDGFFVQVPRSKSPVEAPEP